LQGAYIAQINGVQLLTEFLNELLPIPEELVDVYQYTVAEFVFLELSRETMSYGGPSPLDLLVASLPKGPVPQQPIQAAAPKQFRTFVQPAQKPVLPQKTLEKVAQDIARSKLAASQKVVIPKPNDIFYAIGALRETLDRARYSCCVECV
jgi:hypothetical protein